GVGKGRDLYLNDIEGVKFNDGLDLKLTCKNPGNCDGLNVVILGVSINGNDYHWYTEGSRARLLPLDSDFSTNILSPSEDIYGVYNDMGAKTSSEESGQYYLDEDTDITSIAIRVLISSTMPNTLYTQTADDGDRYSQRWVYLISKEDLSKYKNAVFTIVRNDDKKATKVVTKAYRAISVYDSEESYYDYYWICYSMCLIPDDVTLTATISLTPA
ncbi:MAG: hypothetical protein K6F77_08170, partial [Lachnospiraceae bacterium]|nr:hypothetical protein [Lachnospiraceae bacterium]